MKSPGNYRAIYFTQSKAFKEIIFKFRFLIPKNTFGLKQNLRKHFETFLFRNKLVNSLLFLIVYDSLRPVPILYGTTGLHLAIKKSKYYIMRSLSIFRISKPPITIKMFQIPTI